MKELPPAAMLSETCEVRIGDNPCGRPTVTAYPTGGVQWMALCDQHCAKHVKYCVGINIIKNLGKDEA